jgi:hypothetical protein
MAERVGLPEKCPSNGTMPVRFSINERKLDTANKRVNTPNMGLRRIPVSGLVRYARSFYELLGNRRKFERTPMSGTVFVTCPMEDTTQVASCVDISPRGMAVDCSELLTKDRVVQLHSEEHGPRLLARVRYCLQRSNHYRVGLEFVGEPVDETH